jgi:MSHA pilin protein MshD
MHCSCQRSPGFTLLEVIVTVTVLAIAGSSLITIYGNLLGRSADPVLQQQALAIAEAYMEEIRLQSFDDPDGSDGEASRDLFDDVDDYHNLSDSGAAGQDGVGISGLEDFDVDVLVESSSLAGVAASLRITVDVAHPAIETISLQSYRLDY